MSKNVGKLFCQDGIFNGVSWVPIEIEWEPGADFFRVPLARLF